MAGREEDERWMRKALALSETVLYSTAPNPRVACLIVANGRLLASGVTQPAGGPHAEIMALRAAREQGLDIAGSTFYVTLEPCSHHGRTPPCVDAIVAARPARVVIAMRDPNPLVGGGGLAALRAAGIATRLGLLAQEALEINPGFVARMARGTPWLWLKIASSLDGRVALHSGESQWITGPEARADGHHWRARSSVVLTGAGTIATDDPRLTVRDVDTPRPPIRAVVDTHYSVREDARIVDGGLMWVFTCHPEPGKAARLAKRNVETVVLPLRDGRVDLHAMLEWMVGQGVNEIHVEAGPVLNGALLQAGCVDELLVYMAPLLLGDARGMLDLPPLGALAQASRLEFIDCRNVGPDLRLRARAPARWERLLAAVAGTPAEQG